MVAERFIRRVDNDIVVVANLMRQSARDIVPDSMVTVTTRTTGTGPYDQVVSSSIPLLDDVPLEITEAEILGFYRFMQSMQRQIEGSGLTLSTKFSWVCRSPGRRPRKSPRQRLGKRGVLCCSMIAQRPVRQLCRCGVFTPSEAAAVYGRVFGDHAPSKMRSSYSRSGTWTRRGTLRETEDGFVFDSDIFFVPAFLAD